MKDFSQYNPIAVFVYFLSVAGIAMFSMNPVIIAISLTGAAVLFIAGNRRKKSAFSLFFVFLLVPAGALINPLFNHNGKTVLLVVNDNPVSAEAIIYGAAAAAAVASIVYWFRSFSLIMQSDRILYLFGKAFPKLALILSMAMKFVPVFASQTKKVSNTQKALGLIRDNDLPDRIHGAARVFSVTSTWALENGIVTADSMSARGYGTGQRSFFSRYPFRRSDALLLLAVTALAAVVITGIATGELDFGFYPAIGRVRISFISLSAYTAYTILAFLPSAIGLSEDIRWKYFLSKV